MARRKKNGISSDEDFAFSSSSEQDVAIETLRSRTKERVMTKRRRRDHGPSRGRVDTINISSDNLKQALVHNHLTGVKIANRMTYKDSDEKEENDCNSSSENESTSSEQGEGNLIINQSSSSSNMERPDNKNVECLNKQDMTSCYVKLIRIDESDKKTPTQDTNLPNTDEGDNYQMDLKIEFILTKIRRTIGQLEEVTDKLTKHESPTSTRSNDTSTNSSPSPPNEQNTRKRRNHKKGPRKIQLASEAEIQKVEKLKKEQVKESSVLKKCECAHCTYNKERGFRRGNPAKKTGHMCTICSKCFLYTTHLRRHMSVHSDDHPFVCMYEGCGAKFKLQTTQLIHEKCHKTRERPFDNQTITYQTEIGEMIFACDDRKTVVWRPMTEEDKQDYDLRRIYFIPVEKDDVQVEKTLNYTNLSDIKVRARNIKRTVIKGLTSEEIDANRGCVVRNKWFRAPAQSSCRAYIAARGEVRVLYWVSHPNVVPFIGLCQSPLSILMPRAPRGALDVVLSDYRRSGDKVKEETAQVTIIQIGKALEYLHSHRIIYRDLKSENILVWTFPQPFSKLDDITSVDVKVADYGISRASFPTGSKGFGGTEGFMAPEIIRYNGEEEYTEKVDIFSFGMLLYELISLRQPFDGCENVKESILEGMRPSLSQRDCELYPLYLLDLMVVCWSHASKDRPTATQIVMIASAPEFTIIRDVVSLGSVTNVVAALGLQYGEDREIWASCSTGGIYCLKVKTTSSVDSCHLFEFISGVVTAMCPVDDCVWMGDTMGKISVFKISDYSKHLESDYESLVGYVGAVVSVQFLCSVVGVAFSSGRLFLCDKTTAHPFTELGKTPVIHCLSCRTVEDGLMELWTGEKAGQMTVYSIKERSVSSQEIINHYESKMDAVEVLLVEGHVNQELLFSYVYPGSVVYGWDCNRREMISRLDVGKLLPVKESMEEELNHKPLQVTVLRASLNEVYVGTNRGFVFLADIKRLRPITFFRPFEQDVRSFWIFKNTAKFSGSVGNLSEQKDIVEHTAFDKIHSSASSSNISNSTTDGKTGGGGGGDEPGDIRGISPTPSSSHDTAANTQIVIGIGKGFSNLIEKSVGVQFPEQRQRRKAFAMLWHMSDISL